MFIILVLYQLGVTVTSYNSTLPQRALMHAMHGCIGGKSMATCVTFTDSEFELSLRVRRLERLPLNHLGGEFPNKTFLKIVVCAVNYEISDGSNGAEL